MKNIILATLAVVSLAVVVGSIGAYDMEHIGFMQMLIQSAVAVVVETLSLKSLAK